MEKPYQANQTSIQGVLHHTHSQQFYQLRRYIPTDELVHLVEQFWIVEWELPEGQIHEQYNLPDPNVHLVLDNNKFTVLGPVSKAYRYVMRGTGRVIGVKFLLASKFSTTNIQLNELVDNSFEASVFFPFAEQLQNQLVHAQTDNDIIEYLRQMLKPMCRPLSQGQQLAQQLVEMIKSNQQLTRVDQLAERSGLSSRAIQRYLKHHVGFPPKWLIRKYRMHQVLALLESGNTDTAELALWLGYTDQSHFIHDFKHFTGTSPKRYLDM
ncbi:helix-turn-helix domain-containing protein [Pseudoalteromonas sp. T1lg65]|uniref:helix-turn-helix domain-containing protein n=1 Tax=Pseudoalteromonas sp. T1lg65 TaxID=2077101 RepID=UPI003F7ADDAB